MKSIALVALLFSSAFAAEYLVGVGKDETTGKKGIGFDPSVIHPAVGDTIAFEFRSGSHSAVETTFETPCVPREGGFNSGIFQVEDSLPVDAPNLPIVRITINDTNPIWIFDQAGGLCPQGALLAINPTFTQTPAQFKDNAASSPVAPITTTEGSSGSNTGTATGTGESTTATAPSGNSNNSNDATGMNFGVGKGLVVGLGVTLGAFFGLV